jgi:PPK2 family polyphosphate:nucleotide phosphotransferase
MLMITRNYKKVIMYTPSPIELAQNSLSLSDIDLSNKYLVDKKTYHQELKYWQLQLLKIQQAYYHQNKRAIVILEGWDAAGKGGIIRRLTEKLDPRGFHVYPFAAPSVLEQGRHYLYRFQKCLPIPGTIAIFDRSYFGRVLVERVEKLATAQQWQRAYQEINEFERWLTDDGVTIIKLFIHISPEEQRKRFIERLNNPYKRWKLTEEDIRNREKWAEYEQAINDMFKFTSTLQSPWHIVEGNKKWFARTKALQAIVNKLSLNLALEPPEVDKLTKQLAIQKLEIKDNFV